jgi:hypothetical protein
VSAFYVQAVGWAGTRFCKSFRSEVQNGAERQTRAIVTNKKERAAVASETVDG